MARGSGRSRVDGEVQTILLKCLSKDRQRRYQSAGELARDVRHYLAGEPIEARRDSLAYVLKKHIRRHRLPFALAAMVLLTLFAGLAVSLTFWQQSVRASAALADALGRAQASERETRQVASAQAKMLSDLDPHILGSRLREDVLGEAQAAMERSGAGAEGVAGRIKQLESVLAGMNFTNVGVRSIDRNVLAPALAAIDRDFANQPLVQVALWESIAQVYRQLGVFDTAAHLIEQALATRRRLQGNEHADTLQSMNLASKLLRSAARDAEAEALTIEALETGRRVLGRDHPVTLQALYHMITVRLDHLDYAGAEAVAREALASRQRILGVDHPDTLQTMRRLADVLRQQGKLSEAEPYARETLARRRRVLGDDHAATLESMSALGGLLMLQGKLTEAEQPTIAALAARRRVLGDEHQFTMLSIRSMAFLRGQQGRWEESEQLSRTALEILQRVQGADDPLTIDTLRTLGRALSRQGKLAEAEPYLRESLARRRRMSGGDHPTTLKSSNDLGILRSMDELATLLRLQDKLVEAEQLGAEAVAMARGASQPLDPVIAMSLVHHAQTLVAMGRFTAAEAELLEAREMLAASTEAPHAEVAEAVTALIELYDAWSTADSNEAAAAAAAHWRAKLELGGS